MGFRRPSAKVFLDLCGGQKMVGGGDAGDNVRRNSDIDDMKIAGIFSPGKEHVADFGKGKGCRRMGLNAYTAGLARVGI